MGRHLALLVCAVAVAGIVLSLAAAVLPYRPAQAAGGPVDCQRYADLAEKDADRTRNFMAATSFDVDRAQVWALLYVGCRMGGR